MTYNHALTNEDTIRTMICARWNRDRISFDCNREDLYVYKKKDVVARAMNIVRSCNTNITSDD